MAVTDRRDFFAARKVPWVLLILYVLVSLLASVFVPAWLSIGEPEPQDRPVSAWVLSAGTEGRLDGSTSHWQNRGGAGQHASRFVAVPQGAQFLSLRACSGPVAIAGEVALMLASQNESALDFNRAYRLYAFEYLDANTCVTESFPRWEGDGLAVLQLQFMAPDATVSLSELSVTPLRENPRWRLLRWVMLSIGLLLVVWLFANYLYRRPTIVVLAGLTVVAGILFGVCVSVPLKADIYALMTGGRNLPVELSGAELLGTPFPVGGFSLFTQLHAVFFASACFCLMLVERRAWMDLLLLAVVTETLQFFVPGRGPGWEDALVDATGVAMGLVLVFLVLRSQRIRLLLEHQGIH